MKIQENKEKFMEQETNILNKFVLIIALVTFCILIYVALKPATTIDLSIEKFSTKEQVAKESNLVKKLIIRNNELNNHLYKTVFIFGIIGLLNLLIVIFVLLKVSWLKHKILKKENDNLH